MKVRLHSNLSGVTKAILARRSETITRLMTIYMRRYARRHFHGVRLARGSLPSFDPECGVIVYANHPSWWDPVIFVLLQALVFPRRAGFGPMDASELGRYGVLERIGIFGLDRNSRQAAARFLRVGAGILHTPNTVLWVTAEGEFADPRRRPVRLRPGVAHLLHNHPNVIAIPLALEFTFWNERTPEVLVRFGEPVTSDRTLCITEWEGLLTARLTATMDRLAQDAMTRNPNLFESVVAGRAGIGGIYDVWRRISAAVMGKPANLQHEQPDQAGQSAR